MIDLSNVMSYRIHNLDKQNEKVVTQMSTGRVLNKGSDNSVLFNRYLDIESDLRIQEGLELQLEKTQAFNTMSDTIVKDVKNSIDEIKSHLLKSLNYGMTSDDMKAVAMNLRGIRENILDFANTTVDGEYIFSGSDTTKQAMVKDNDFKINGQVDFGGNSRLRKVAVDKGVYRDRGITITDVLMYNTDVASKGSDTISFTKRETIVDEFGYTWKLNSAEDKLEKYDEDGTLTGDYFSVTGDGGDPEIFTTETLDDALSNNHITQTVRSGLKLEAKHNYLDDLNIVINALEGYSTKRTDNSDNGEKDAEITLSDIRPILNDILDKTSKQYDATNIGHAELGGRNKIFNDAIERVGAKITHFNILLQETNGADLAKLAMESKSLELTYNALYSTISKLNNLSLVNFLR